MTLPDQCQLPHLSEVNVMGSTVDQAIDRLVRFLDEALLTGVRSAERRIPGRAVAENPQRQ